MHLSGQGVHVVTVNDYLGPGATRTGWGKYRFLDTTVGVIVHGLDDAQRNAAYGCDITYGTNNEYGASTIRATT